MLNFYLEDMKPWVQTKPKYEQYLESVSMPVSTESKPEKYSKFQQLLSSSVDTKAQEWQMFMHTCHINLPSMRPQNHSITLNKFSA